MQANIDFTESNRIEVKFSRLNELICYGNSPDKALQIVIKELNLTEDIVRDILTLCIWRGSIDSIQGQKRDKNMVKIIADNLNGSEGYIKWQIENTGLPSDQIDLLKNYFILKKGSFDAKTIMYHIFTRQSGIQISDAKSICGVLDI